MARGDKKKEGRETSSTTLKAVDKKNSNFVGGKGFNTRETSNLLGRLGKRGFSSEKSWYTFQGILKNEGIHGRFN